MPEVLAPVRSPNVPGAFAASDVVVIRGKRLVFAELVDPRLFDAAYRQQLREQLHAAQPYEHLVVDGWFNRDLLKLAREEFDLYPFDDGRDVDRKYENTYRSPRHPQLGPAAHLYFSIVNSGWFTALLADITEVHEPIADPTLHNGGLHESRNGGKFNIHRDFERSQCTNLRNEVVLLTYLNENWNPAWHGALELWDAGRAHCVCKVEPELGRSILMRNSAVGYHGHPTPLAMPEGQVRRSLVTYYYSNSLSPGGERERTASLYLYIARADRLKHWARQLTPPIIWDGLTRLLK
ncbi:MAG TPA: 2OG-Fe(II) oxygenase [Albitalea sp.]|nr:2OG-Fe(II) oxygenase [Albitalea sp.]